MGLWNKLFRKQKSRCVSLKKTSTMMDEQRFWHLIQNSLNESKSQDDQESWLIKKLQTLPLEEISGFRLRTDKLLYDTYTSEMWCAAYLINGGCSDDCFEYFRCWLVSRGENTYQKAKANPDSLIDEVVESRDLYDFESFWYVALKAFEINTGENLYDFIDYDDFTTCEGKYPAIEFNWQEDHPETMEKICPKLFKKFA